MALTRSTGGGSNSQPPKKKPPLKLKPSVKATKKGPKLPSTYAGPSPFTTDQAIQGVVDLMSAKPVKNISEQEIYLNFVRLYGEGEADEKMRAYRARGSNQLKRTGWGGQPGQTVYKGIK